MIEFCYETGFRVPDETAFKAWLGRIADKEGVTIEELTYIFCNDRYLVEINKKYLDHDTLTDIITFPYGDGDTVWSDIYISEERVAENAQIYGVSKESELLRVMAHGLLHLVGYGDKTSEESALMREKEEECIKMFHVEP